MSLVGSCRPRVYTPPLRELTPDTTLGYDVCDFSERVVGIEPLDWQRWLLVHALEVVGDLDGEWCFRFRTVLVLVARQNGKTFISQILALYFLYVLCVALIIGTAQDVEQAEDTWQETVETIEGIPDLNDQVKKVWHTNGAKRLELFGGRVYRTKASTRRAGRGKSGDLIMLDELREHQDFKAWGAISKTILARRQALVWCTTNAGDGTSVVLRHLRLVAHAAIGDPDGIVAAAGDSAPVFEGDEDVTIGIFEWSAEPDGDPGDPRQWALANPSLGKTDLDERSLRSAYQTDTADVWRTECLCQWVTASVDPPFPEGSWEAGKDPTSAIADDSPLTYGIDVAADRGKAWVAVCGLRPDRKWHVEVVAGRNGTKWLVDWFRERAPERPMRVAMQARGAPVSAFCDILAAIDGVSVVECQGPQVTGWAGRLWDAVAALDPKAAEGARSDAVPVMHRPQPALDLAAELAATRPLGDGAWAWDRNKSREDISPLVAVTMAFGAATEPEEAPSKSAYEDNGIMII